MVDFTVVVPTYNGAQRLPQLLGALRSQVNTESIHWEILVVDNNSSDSTKQLIESYQAIWSGWPMLRYTFESQQGAAYARQRGMQDAVSEWVSFVDDDVIPSSDWVSTAYSFRDSQPQLGAYGGQIHPQFESDPPEDFKRIQSFLAIRERGDQPHLYDPENLVLPPSAAWVVCRQAWLDSVPTKPNLSGRVKGSMVQGDDYEPLIYMHLAGWKIWYNPDMHVSHQIPKGRLEPSYLVNLSRGCGLCVYSLRQIMAENLFQQLLLAAKITAGGLKRALMLLLDHQQKVFTDVVLQCQMVFFLSSAASPFYSVKALLKRDSAILP
ncbi:hormogonium polysaccharide biosynthesis glycosyltransferase HpsE [Leptothoe sp. PORK10 BA2]|uniref:hormogonium polysaccharide biosynthesis glycosyltransferase HpsE n=1 Tax=Leptothoe sp. PORK10 BA2 TaxID=3110254 RepID=UPI002B1FC759|nr:hormogonium polysaccharide biosynthesis glycosyltransferase HpsE [Leptothoe sp. PORK10 BA2]MEA5463861.1 hormogonium polysaccharide biosynthesis glycosyltransferase HpsE [Leptothoe sp. PORK10 BA2]